MPPPTEEEDHDVYRGEDEDDEEEEDIETDDDDEDDDDDDDEEDEDLEEEEEDLNYDSPSTSSENPNINKIDSSAASVAVAVAAATTAPTTTTTILPSETQPTTTTAPIITIATPISASAPTSTTTTTTTTTIDISTVQNGSQVVTPSPAVVVSELFPDHKRQRTNEPSSFSAATTTTTTATATTIEEKKPSAIDDSRRLFQRLWTDEDEIGLLQGFLDYTIQRGHKNSSHHHHDTAPFYDQIKTRLQLDFNKNQLVEKLRRLKKKYRNVMARINSGKDFNFKSPHDQATFEISRKIWSSDASVGVGEAGIEDEEGNNPTHHQQNVETTNNHGFVNNGTTTTTTTTTTDVTNTNTPEKKVPRSRKRSRKTEPEPNLPNPSSLSNIPVALSIPNVIEDTVRSCLSPLLKELLYSVVNGSGNARVLGGMALNPLPLHFGGGNSSLNLLSGEMVDEKWRKQQILELEVYSKRMELVQDQIKLALEELRSKGSS